MSADNQITVFTSNGWGPCHMVKVYLSRKDIPFEEVNVSGNREGVMRLIALGRNTTPVTTIGDEVIVGYKPKDIDAALETAGIS